jgi:hypothetical protein
MLHETTLSWNHHPEIDLFHITTPEHAEILAEIDMSVLEYVPERSSFPLICEEFCH